MSAETGSSQSSGAPQGAGSLFVVATPIGNLSDMTPRAVEVLSAADVIAAEDTRHSATLMAHYDIKTPMISLHDHNEQQRIQQFQQRLESGQSIALISDAGTPTISDPGFVLVRAIRAAGLKVVPVPGCSAVITALSAAGLPTDRFTFEGFLPSTGGARLATLSALKAESRTMVFYESPRRINKCLSDVIEAFGGERPVAIARELTKQFESVVDGTASEVAELFSSEQEPSRGEFVVIIGGCPAGQGLDDEEAERILTLLLEELPAPQASKLTAKITGLKKRDLYQRALQLKGE